MATASVVGRMRNTLTIVFGLFLLLNVVVLTITVLSFRHGDALILPTLGHEAVGLRLTLVLVGAAVGYLVARLMYVNMVESFVSPDHAINAASSLMLYVVLFAAAFAFLGPEAWYWLPVLFLLVLVWSVVTIWSLVGVTAMAATLVVALAGIFVTWYLLS